MSQNKGYYCLVQFCPDPSRLESVNVGVVLYSQTEKRLLMRISRNNARIRKFFGNQDWAFVNRARTSIENQLRTQQFSSLEELNDYILRRANIIQLTAPRPIRITDMDSDITQLQERLVGRDGFERKRRVNGYLTKRLFEAGVVDLVKKSVDVEIPELKKSIRVPYAYQNGRFNLISPVQFDPDPDAIFTKTGKSAIEGQLLYKERHPTFGDMRLVVVANFDQQIESSTRELVKRIFNEHRVTLYSFDDLNPLVEDIRRSAAEHGA